MRSKDLFVAVAHTLGGHIERRKRLQERMEFLVRIINECPHDRLGELESLFDQLETDFPDIRPEKLGPLQRRSNESDD